MMDENTEITHEPCDLSSSERIAGYSLILLLQSGSSKNKTAERRSNLATDKPDVSNEGLVSVNEKLMGIFSYYVLTHAVQPPSWPVHNM